MFNNPYQTRQVRDTVLGEIVSGLQHAYINKELLVVRTGKDVPVPGLFQVPPYVKSIPPFGQPIEVKVSDQTIWVIDTRAFTRYDAANETLKVTIPSDYDQLTLYGRLVVAWNQGHQADMSALGDIVPRVFTNMLSQNIVRRLGLSPQDQQFLSAMTAYYYFCLFQRETTINEQTMLAMATRIARVTSISGEDVLRILGTLQLTDDRHLYATILDISQYVAVLRDSNQSPRLKTLNELLIYTSVGTAWFGANGRENVAVSLEYPPLFITLVYKALMDRTYHGAMLTRFVEISNKREAGADFTRNLANFLEMMSHA